MSELIDHQRMRNLATAIHILRDHLEETFVVTDSWDAGTRTQWHLFKASHLIDALGVIALINRRLTELMHTILMSVDCLGVTDGLRSAFDRHVHNCYRANTELTAFSHAVSCFGVTGEQVGEQYENHETAETIELLSVIISGVHQTARDAASNKFV